MQTDKVNMSRLLLTQKPRQLAEVKKKDFDRLVASVKQAGKVKLGKLKPSRVFRFKPADIKAIPGFHNLSSR